MLTAAKKEFIEFMMSADVLRFGDFTTKSGRKTPYFVNTGNYKTGLQNSRLGEVGTTPGKTAVMEVGEEFGIKVHALVTVQDIREYLADKAEYAHLLPLMDAYMEQYCVF